MLSSLRISAVTSSNVRLFLVGFKRGVSWQFACSLPGFHPVGTHIPLILSCGHSFCEGCLFKLCIKKTEIDCPTCEVSI